MVMTTHSESIVSEFIQLSRAESVSLYNPRTHLIKLTRPIGYSSRNLVEMRGNREKERHATKSSNLIVEKGNMIMQM